MPRSLEQRIHLVVQPGWGECMPGREETLCASCAAPQDPAKPEFPALVNKHARSADRMPMPFPTQLPRGGVVLSLCLVVFLLGPGVFALTHCHAEHEGWKSAANCSLCAFVFHVATVLRFSVSLASRVLTGRIRLTRGVRRKPLSCPPFHIIRAPPS